MRKLRKNNGGFAGILGLLLLIVFAGCLYFGIVQNWSVTRDTTAWLDRAQVASNPTDMREYLINCRDGMIEWDLDTGHDAIIFETPENDMELVMKALENSISRCYEVETMNTTSPEYQTALDDLRGQIRELDIHSTGRYWVKHWYILWIAIFSFIFALILFAVAITEY